MDGKTTMKLLNRVRPAKALTRQPVSVRAEDGSTCPFGVPPRFASWRRCGPASGASPSRRTFCTDQLGDWMPVEMTVALTRFSIACRFSILACAVCSFGVCGFPSCGPLQLQPLDITRKTRPDAPRRGEAAWSLVRLRLPACPLMPPSQPEMSNC